MSEEEFIAKISWEGGVMSALEYGLKWTDLEDQSTELAQRWRRLQDAYSNFRPAIEQVEAVIPDESW